MRNTLIRLALPILLCLPAIAYSQQRTEDSLMLASYDMVWETVNETHYDPSFGGLDWNEVYNRYRDSVAGGVSDDDFVRIANKMLQEMHLSHYAVFFMKEKGRSGSPLLSAGTVGMDVRLLDDKVVVTSVKPGFSAALAGLEPGYVIESMDSIPVGRIIEDTRADQLPHFNERNKLSEIGDELINRLYGSPGTQFAIGYRDGSGSFHETTLTRRERTGKTILSEEFPPVYIDFSAHRLDGNIGYVTFSAFVPPVDEKFINAIDSMQDVRGLIIDIRGNPGGMHEVGEAIASKLIKQETLFSVFKYRDSTVEVVVQPEGNIYDGPVVVMIDVMNASASERFSGCIQSIGRAVILGERSPGIVGPSDLKELPNGATFMCLVAQSLTPDGLVLEGHGVVPDIEVALDPEQLLSGVDTQLQRAIEYIMQETR